MKKTILMALIIILFSSGADSKEIKLSSEEWPPYAFTEKNQITGYCTEIIKTVFAKMGITPIIETYPWVRAEKMAIDGDVDGLYSASRKPDREAACYYPDEKLFDSEYVFFIHKKNAGKFKYDGFDDLKGKIVGVTHGYSYNQELWNFLNTHKNFQEAPTDEINFRLLAEERIDYFPAEIGNGMALIKKMNISEMVTYISSPFIQKPYYIIFNRKKVEASFVKLFSDELKAFKATPEFQAVRSKYFR